MRNAENYVRIRFHLMENLIWLKQQVSRFQAATSVDYLFMHADQHLLHMVLHSIL